MGQYYKAVNVDNGEWLYPHDYDNGMKLMEHSYLGNKYVGAVMSLLTPKGKWSGSRIVWAGDYGRKKFSDFMQYNNDEIKNLTVNLDSQNKNIYEQVEKEKKIECKSMHSSKQKKCYIINDDKKEYFYCGDLIEEDGSIINPLPILTSDENGNGGGDYYGKNEQYAGSWCGDRIRIVWKKPDKYKKIDYYFKEE